MFHDVDMLPIDVDYSYSDVPIHLATNFTNSDREIFKTYFGGITISLLIYSNEGKWLF